MNKRIVSVLILTAFMATMIGGPASAADPKRPNCKTLGVLWTDKNCVAAFDWYDSTRSYIKSSDAYSLAGGAAVLYGPYATSYQMSQLDEAIRYYGSDSSFRTCFRNIEVKFAYEIAKQKSAIAWHKGALSAIKKALPGPYKSLVTAYLKVARAAYGAYASAMFKSRAKQDITIGVISCAM